MKQRKPLEIISLLSAAGAVLCTPWILHGAINSGESSNKIRESTQNDYSDTDTDVAGSTEYEPSSGEVVDGPIE
jgi:hypothetical protein